MLHQSLGLAADLETKHERSYPMQQPRHGTPGHIMTRQHAPSTREFRAFGAPSRDKRPAA
jgi:hypothetical protein